MKPIYRLMPDAENFKILRMRTDDDDLFNQFVEGGIQLSQWTPPLVGDIEGIGNRPLGDFPCMWLSAPLISNKAWDDLRPYIGHCAKAFPVEYSGGSLLMLYVHRILDVLDRERSSYSVNPTLQEVSSVHAYRFKPNADLDGETLFRLPETRGIEVLATQEFRRLTEKLGLKGLSWADCINGGQRSIDPASLRAGSVGDGA